MLLINENLIKMSKGFRGWILLITFLKFVILVGITMFANSMAAALGGLFGLLDGNAADLKYQLIKALESSLIMLAGELLVGEAEYRCTAQARRTLRAKVMNKILELDVGDVDRLGVTRTINAGVDGIETMQVYYTRYLPGFVYGLIAPIYLFFVLKNKCMPAAILLLCCAIVILPLNNIFRDVLEKLKSAYWRDLADLTSYYLESINSLTTTELFGRGGDREKTLGQKAKKLTSTILGVMRKNFLSAAFNETLMNTAIFASTVIVCRELIIGNISLVSALAVLMLSYGFFSSIRKLQWIAHDALMGIAAAQNLSEIFNTETSMEIEQKEYDKEQFDGIRFKDVCFSYKDRDPVLKGLNLDIPRGKTTAIVGESGCGKSTTVNMLLRFYDAQKGHIYFHGRDYKSVVPRVLRDNIIMVPQQVFIFSGTIKDNLLIADPNASDEKLMEVLELVRLKDWIMTKENGLYEFVGDAGSRLSGGQRQKIGIARALLCQSEYIVFDEATSSVDEESEREIWACIEELSKIRTLIIISHRLSTVRKADVIYVIESGVVVQSGNHSELMDKQGLYRNLVEQQNALEESGKRRRGCEKN